MANRLPLACLVCIALGAPLGAATVGIDGSAGGRQQPIDGFGTCIGGGEGGQTAFQQMYFDDMGCSMLRIDLTPSYVSPFSDNQYNSPTWAQPGPNGTYSHPYTSASTYTASWNGIVAPIAVMGPDIAQNIAKLDWSDVNVVGRSAMMVAGKNRAAQLGGFKLFASVWSPPPWLKLSSGHSIGATFTGGPAAGTPWPFIWLGNFAGGKLDTSGAANALFNDGSGPTSALTQWARTIAAELKGYQDRTGVPFYAVSLQNELNFEEFYNSCDYETSAEYIAMVRAVRAELNKYGDLAGIKIMGPEDLLGGDAYAMWQYGSGTHKNLQYLQNIAADPAAATAIEMFCIHGYAPDGASAAGADPTSWSWWANGWATAPAIGVPANIKGFTAYGKKSWMTETSGEDAAWLSPASGFPSNGAFSIAVKIHQALTAGRESGWAYCMMGNDATTSSTSLTDANTRANAPKYVAAKHFFKCIRPGSVRLSTSSSASDLLASSYVNDASGALTIVLVNSNAAAQSVTVTLPSTPSVASFMSYTSSNSGLWQTGTLGVSGGQATISVPGYGVVTLTGVASAPPPPAPNAGYVSQSVPMAMVAGQQHPVSVTMSNTGNTTWTAAGGYKLGSQNAQDNSTWGSTRVLLAAGDSIAPGQSKTFSWTVTAPAAGSYHFQWRMVQEGVQWFGAYAADVTVSVSAAPSGSGTGLTAQYWSNQLGTFNGAPTITRTDATVDFDWGGGSPDAAITADDFTARWSGQVQATYSETYTFFVTGDDGVRLWVNGQLLVDRWIDQGPTEWSGAIALTAGQKVDLKLEYYEHGGGAVARLAWSSPSTPKAIVPQSQLFPAGSGGGLIGQYWTNQAMTFDGAPTLTRTDATVDFDWGNGSPDASITADNFTARWSGQVQAAFSETYTFFVTGDDGVRLWVNGQPLIDRWIDQGPTEWSGAIALSAGQQYDIKLEYYEHGGGAVARLAWSSASTPKAIVPQGALFPASGTGLSATYWDNIDFTGATVSRVDPSIDFDWGSGSPDPAIGVDTFSARWTGYLRPAVSGTYTFNSTSDDGTRVWVNGQLVIDNWTDHPPTADSGAIALTAGLLYPIRMDYYENGGGAEARLSWVNTAAAASGVTGAVSAATPTPIPMTELFPGAIPVAAAADGGTSRCGLGTGFGLLLVGLASVRRRRR